MTTTKVGEADRNGDIATPEVGCDMFMNLLESV